MNNKNTTPITNSYDTRFALTVDKAEEQLERIISTYLAKNKDGSYVIPFNRQRPIMLMGPAGIGKTDAPRQIAEKLEIGFVSYSMTHHTRQSAMGLPKITEKNFSGTNELITEYTMSEIISAVYDEIERTGNPNGILFLDEINCIPESMSAVMLQLFQNKTLGQRRIPEGWVLVLAGNPPEYNKNVKLFDAVTRDRIRIINVVPDAQAWLNYAEARNLNSAVVSYIGSNNDKIHCFDSASSQIVTPRGWEELAINIDVFEKNGFPVNAAFVAEFIGMPDVASEFYDYYDMITRNVTENNIDEIINGTADSELEKLVRNCSGNIRYMLIICLKRRLRVFSAEKNYSYATTAMDNIVKFLEKACKTTGETELFMSGILADPEIVKMTITTRNEHFSKYLNDVVTTEDNIKNRLKQRKREVK